MLKVGFIGAGRMAHALAKGLITAGVTKGEHIVASCAAEDQQSISVFKSLGAKMTFHNPEVVQDRDVIVVSTKPDIVPIVLKETKNTITNKNLIISLAMGVSVDQLEQNLPKGTRVIRAMPNTPALVLSGATVFVCGSAATVEDAKIAQRFFKAVGTCEQVSENFLDVITGLSGAGPAYVYIFIEALADGAVRMGLPRDLAYRLAAQTVIGAGKMVQETQEHPGQLKDNVTSPGGTASVGVYELEKNGLRRAVMDAIEVATNKSKEISQTLIK